MTADVTTDWVAGEAAIADGAGSFAIRPIAVAPPAAGEVRIRLAWAGLCHTDLASLHGPGPLVMGHEGAGHVEAVGAGVAGLAPGMPVLLNWAIGCGVCFQCEKGHAALCERTLEPNGNGSAAHAASTLLAGAPVRRSFHLGTFARHTIVRAEAVTPLPGWLPLRDACFIGCAVMTGVGSAINVAAVAPGDSVAVVGCGSVGLNVIQGARIARAGRIIAIDRNPASLARARHFGATDCVEAADPDALANEVRALTGGRGADHGFEATGRAELAFLPLKLVRNGGNAVQVSGAHGSVPATMPDFFWAKRYITALYGDCLPARDFPRLFEWVRQGRINLADLVGGEYPLEELGSAIADLEAGRVAKAVLRLA